MLNNKEWKLIKFAAGADNCNIGDDCAVWEKKSLVITTDHMCEGVHFDLSFMPPNAVGWRLMAANASDILSMGSRPVCYLLNIAVPKGKIETAEKMISGIKQFASNYDISLIGGDTTGGKYFTVGVTMFGEKPEKPLLRSGAKPGDTVYLSAPVGLSKCGYFHVKNKTDGFELSKKRFLFPDPFTTMPISFRDINSAIDISDSLITELELLSRSSNVKIEVDYDMIPIEDDVKKSAVLLKIPLEEIIFGSGEEFVLLFTSDKLITGSYPVGKIIESKEPEVEVFNKNGAIDLTAVAVFNHLS